MKTIKSILLALVATLGLTSCTYNKLGLTFKPSTSAVLTSSLTS